MLIHETESPASLAIGWGSIPKLGNPELYISSSCTESQMLNFVGKPAYSYRLVFRAFLSMLKRWAPIYEVNRPEMDLSGMMHQAQERGAIPMHLSFLPLHMMHIAPQAINIAVPAWEFPNIPDCDLGGNPQHNWLRQSERLNLIITHTRFSRDAFLRAGVKTPIHVVPVPINPTYFETVSWEPEQRVVIDCPCYLFPSRKPASGPKNDQLGRAPVSRLARGSRWLQGACRGVVESVLPQKAIDFVAALRQGAAFARQAYQEKKAVHTDCTKTPNLELSGVVYTTILNPVDGRKNWEDLLTGFLLALGEYEDATLVFKIIASPQTAQRQFDQVVGYYQRLKVHHHCKIAFVADFLSEAQLVELARATTYYLNTSRAEGSCLPLQEFLAAGRPAVAPANTGMTDSLCAENAFLVESNPEPIGWPQDPDFRLTTTWHRLVWQSLHDQLRESYRVAKEDRNTWLAMSAHARQKMADLASPECVWRRLRLALDEALRGRASALGESKVRDQGARRAA